MTATSQTAGEVSDRRHRSTFLSDAWLLLRNDKTSLVSVVFLACVLIGALAVQWLPPVEIDPIIRNQPPVLWGGSIDHPLGTDQLGRDVLIRVLAGARETLALSTGVVIVSVLVGATIGMLSGFRGGRSETVVMRTIDVFMSFPTLLLALVVLFVVGQSVVAFVAVLVLTRWMLYARVARAETKKYASMPFTRAAIAAGSSPRFILRQHIRPNVMPALAALAVLEGARVMVAEAGLSFLGFGVSANSWGLQVAEGRSFLSTSWWISTVPGVAIALTSTALGLLAQFAAVLSDPPLRVRRANDLRNERPQHDQLERSQE